CRRYSVERRRERVYGLVLFWTGAGRAGRAWGGSVGEGRGGEWRRMWERWVLVTQNPDAVHRFGIAGLRIPEVLDYSLEAVNPQVHGLALGRAVAMECSEGLLAQYAMRGVLTSGGGGDAAC